MRFHSILFEQTEWVTEREEPECFSDLNLDRMLDSLSAGRKEYDLAPFFYAPLRDAGAVEYRHEVLRDLEEGAVAEAVRAFARAMRSMREHLARAEEMRHEYQKKRWYLEAVEVYCDAVRSLAEGLSGVGPNSRGLTAFAEYLGAYAASEGFASLAAEARELREDLAGVGYTVRIRGSRVDVGKYDSEADYSAEVEKTFERFEQGATKDYRTRFSGGAEMDSVEERVLDIVALLHPEIFGALDAYCARHGDYLDPKIGAFDREVQFYLAYLEHIGPLKKAGLPFCYPNVSVRPEEVVAEGAFDLALAGKLFSGGRDVVRNGFRLRSPERVLVVSGPNQGGKTTFARMFGQLHYLASLGLPVPGRRARLSLPDRVFTHFEREEDLATLRGKLEDELFRIRDVLERATGESVLVMNESFTSTTLSDALLIGTAVMGRIMELDLLCVYVTFVDELASLGEGTVSMVSTVVPEDPAQRTFEIVRKPADGLAYAAAIAEKHGLTYDALRRRMAR